MSWKKTIIHWFLLGALFSLIAIIQASSVSSFKGVVGALNLPLIALLFSLVFYRPAVFLVLASILGFWLDILNFEFFGLHLIVLSLTIYLLYLILTNVVTNRSLYSFLILAILGPVIYNLLLYTIVALVPGGSEPGFFLVSGFFWKYLLWQIIWSAGFMLLFFNLANNLSKNLKPFFLEKK